MAISIKQSGTGGNGETQTLTVTFGSALTAGNALIVAIGAGGTKAVSTVALSDSTALTQRVTDATNKFASIWDVFNVTGGQTTVVVTLSAASSFESIEVAYYEVSGLSGTSDTTHSANGTTSPYASGAVSTGNAADLWIGCVGDDDVSGTAVTTLTGPSSPWTNTSQISEVPGTGNHASFMAGSQITSSTGSLNYSVTSSKPESWSAVAAAYEATPNTTTTGAMSMSGTMKMSATALGGDTTSTGAMTMPPAFHMNATDIETFACTGGMTL